MAKEKIQKKYHTIGETAKMLGVAPSLIRFWESRFKAINPRKTRNGVRQYTKDDIEKLKTIYYLVKEKGYTLQGADEVLNRQGENTDNVLDLIQEMEALKKFLLDLKKSLNQPKKLTAD